MITSGEIKVRIFYALLGDTLSRAFNLLRIAIFVLLLGSIVVTACRVDHPRNLTWIWDAGAGGILAFKLGRWIRIEC